MTDRTESQKKPGRLGLKASRYKSGSDRGKDLGEGQRRERRERRRGIGLGERHGGSDEFDATARGWELCASSIQGKVAYVCVR